MGRVIVIQFVTLDGVTQDPDGKEGFEHGGWAFRTGPQAVAGDKFKLGELFDTSVLLLGRRTWEHFSRIWPSRSDDFSSKMNGIRKVVLSRSQLQLDAWSNSGRLEGDLVSGVRKHSKQSHIVIAGSDSVVRTLMEHDLIDEYRLLVFPIVLGQGRRLFKDGIGPIGLQLLNLEQSGEAALLTYGRHADAAAR